MTEPSSETPPALTYEFLVHQLDKDLAADGATKIVLISPTAPPQAGNDATLMLSQALASELGARVVMVDGVFGSSAISSDLGLYNRPGFADWLYEEEDDLEACILTAGHHRLSILPAGYPREDRPRAVSVERINELFAWLLARYDYVVLQQGPLASDPRYLAFAAKAGAVLILAEEDRTPVAELESCLSIFRSHQISKIHLILCEPD